MQFYETHYLKFLFSLPLLLVLGWLSAGLWRRRLRKLGYAPVVTAKLIPGYRRAEAGIRIFFLLLVFLFLILALARPQWGDSSKKVERKGVDIVFMLDTSLSMLSEDVKPSRFQVASQEIKSIIRKLKGDRVGLVVFSGSAYLQVPLTLDYSAFMLFLESVKVGHVPDPGSSLSSALNYVLRIFPKEDLKYKVLVLMTEGEDTLGGIDESLKAMQEAKIRVYTIGMGTEAGGPIPLKDQTGRQVGFKKDRTGSVVISRMAPEVLKKIAEATGGIFLPSTTAGREVDLLLKHISSLGQKNINEKMIAEKEDHYGFFLLWALIFLLLEMFVLRSQRIKPTLMMFAALILFSGFMETPRGLNKQGNEEFAQKKYQSALAAYQKAKVKAPEDAAIRYNLGSTLYQTNQYKDARQEFQKAVDLSKQDPELQAKSYYNLGNTEYRLGNFEGAIKNYKEALKLNPKDVDAKSNLEFVQNKKSMFDKKNDEKKKDNPEQKNEQQDKQNQDQQNQDQQQQQQQNQQDQNQQNQQNQDQQDQNQKDQQNQDQQNQQNQNNQQQQDQSQQNQDQSQQDQQEGGQGGGSGQQDPNSQPQDSEGQQPKDSQDQSGDKGDQNQPDQKENQEQDPNKEAQDAQKNQEKSGEQGEQSPQQEKKSDTGQQNPPEQQPQQEPKEKQGQDGQQGEPQQPQEKQPSEEAGQSEEEQEQPQDQQQPQPGQQEQSEQQQAQPDLPEPQNEDQPGGSQGQEAQDLEQQQPQPSEELGQEQGQESETEAGEGQDSAEKGAEMGNSGGSGTQYQGQMSMDSALKILDALHEGEKEFSDLRRPPARRQQANVEKDW